MHLRVGKVKRFDRELLLAICAEGRAAADDHLQVGPGLEQRRRESRSGGEQLLEVVQDQQQLLVAEMLDQPVQRQPVADQLQIQGLGDHGGNEIRIPYRRQRDEIHAVGKLVERLRRNLEAQPRLADAAGAGQRQQALAFQQLFGLQDRVGAADEAGQLGGQVVGRPVERAQGRELIRHAGHDQLEEAFSPCQVAQAMGAQVPQRELVWQAFHDQRFGALGNEDLAPVRGTGDPRRVMDVQADVLVAHQGRLARMKADPDP